MKIITTKVALLIFILLPFLPSCKCHHKADTIRVTGIEKDSLTYLKDQVIVIFKQTPSEEQINRIKQAYLSEGMTDSIQIQKCSECDQLVQLWAAPDIETYLSTEGVKAGSSGSSQGVGEDSLAIYSLNYINPLPTDLTLTRGQLDNLKPDSGYTGINKDTVVIAVLDSGIDTAFINGRFLWRNVLDGQNGVDDDNNCLTDDAVGWNFVDNTPGIKDDNINIHGTLVSQYIINEFASSAKNYVQIMVLKTHNSNGQAELFKTICALHYAIAKKAMVVNASWGFYNYHENPLPYLDSLITHILPDHGILFFAAAGNKNQRDDSLANELYKLAHNGADIPDTNMLRNLEIHNFYPACLSTENNNVITVTTTDEIRVSSTQNFSDKFADLGIKADSVALGHMFFKQPFQSIVLSNNFLSGSSFATPVALGKFASIFKVTHYVSGIKKSDFFDDALATSFISTSENLKNSKLIRKGKFSKHLP